MSRATLLPYGRQSIDDDDIAAVVAALRSDWLTTGPRVPEFEGAFAKVVGARFAVAVSSGTAALHAAIAAADVGPGDEVVVGAMTFAASSNAALYLGAIPVFADVAAETLLVSPQEVERLIGPKTRAIVAIDYAGQPCDYEALGEIARRKGVALIADACHAIGAEVNGRKVGSLADLSTFSFHPAKHVATGEGGMITTDDEARATRMRHFRNHGITTDHRQRAESGTVFYDMEELGYNYRLTDFQAALGKSQLRRLPEFVARRQTLARFYDERLAGLDFVNPLARRPGATHAYHLYVVRFDTKALGLAQAEILAKLRAAKIGANVHYRPPHLHPYYRRTLGTGEGLCPAAEAAYREIVTLPLFPAMTEADVGDVVEAIRGLAR